MSLPKIIVVATDFSAHAQAAQADAIALAKALNAHLVLVHVWQVPLAAPEGAWVLIDDVCTQLEAAERAKQHEALEQVRAELPSAEGLFVVGDPRAGILAAARDKHADLIVLGTHGRRGLSRVLLGSVAEWVVHHAPCATWLVRHGASEHDGGQAEPAH
jgi:nucleotide-binding universal stress UspA family protein